MGELHLEVIKHRMERDFNLKVKFHKPRVSYREKLLGTVTASIDFHRQLPSGTMSFGLTVIAEEVNEPGLGIRVVNELTPESVPKVMLQVLLEALEKEALGGGCMEHR